MFDYRRSIFATFMLALGLLLGAGFAQAQIAVTNKISDVRGTKHNLSAAADGSATPSGGTVPVRTIKASSETQVCVFCHTPHEATAGIVAPLWNRALSGATYPNVVNPTYSSSSIEASAAELAAGPGGTSKLCLSCHDGTMAIDKVNVLNGIANATPAMTGLTGAAGSGKLPATTATTGFTRNLGTNLSNDHPISFTYNSTLATADGELRAPDGTIVGNRVAGAARPKMPLEGSQMQCATCHDPHLRDTTTTNGNAKFLRVNRFQVVQPTGGTFNQTNDTICIACHDKGGLAWAYSAHANQQVATQTYKSAAATTREFPLNALATSGPPVWQVGCLNCHDTHTVQGARRLLREGTDSAASPKAGGNPAMEETCYQCHSNTTDSVVNYTALGANAVPDIKTDFALARRMPITGTERHDIGGVFNDGIDANCSKTAGKCGKDLLESRANLANRHAECSDCHNPHRVVKFRDFRGAGGSGNITSAPDAAGTHQHTDDAATNHTNIASGVLRGSWGVEPTYGSASFHVLPSGYDVKRGDPGNNASSLVGASYVTREYQICLKCHSDYGYPDNNVYPNGNRPLLGAPGTPSGANGLTMYTNQAKEFQAPLAHQDEPLSLGTAAGTADANFNANNHRSWHPVMGPTGRTAAKRSMTGGVPWEKPWGNQVGVSTMYCSDCHGSSTASASSVIPDGGDNGKPWGPHGSTNDFLLKGAWTDAKANTANVVCFKCHVKANYSSTADGGGGSWGGGTGGNTTGFSGSRDNNLHNYHADKVGAMRCTWCHVAVPHGWRNKALLVNLNDIGQEAGQGAGSSKEVSINGNADVYTQEPYYFKAKNKIVSFASSGNWSENNCGSRGKSGTGLTTGRINSSNGQTSNNTLTGKDWMRATCDPPP